MADTWDLFVLEYARSHQQPWVDLISGMYEDGKVDLPFSFMLAQQGDRNVLIDTGFMQGEGSSGFSEKFGVPNWVSPVRMLEEVGVSADAVTDIVITHAHFDHMGSVGEFPNANLIIQKSELLTWYEAIALPKRFGYLTAIIDPDNLKTALEASIEHRVTLVDGDKDNVLPGLHVRLGSGHTVGQQFVIVETGRGRLVVSGDCVYSRMQITGRDNDGVYIPLNNATGCVWDQLKTIDKINTEIGGDQERLIVLHDIDRWPGLPLVKEVEGFKIVKAG
ncbi:N-acyl homoserine lactonase family protein [Bauldia litoralis]|uniref:Metallo-beta-lactamase superfamily protein n=1 Tax=Bauldia litoralis TaxID=665467 RepID=A0A1G6CX11_9HYPH|nr:N-acyl homoserine lactonase family protein [Bauldia litoralis]SDB37389.1 Metallo-beta-lactamase superfamily protein [Bauldia litoralis]